MSLVTVIIATFNSQRLLSLVLSSIRNQTYPQNKIEILIVDGGSRDTTLEIAKKFRCSVIANPKIEPLYAKYLGYLHAKGKYIIYIDHDEVMQNPNSLRLRVDVFLKEPGIKAIAASGYISPQGYQVVNRYINEFGDPFSFFMYRLSKRTDFFMNTMSSRYSVVSDCKEYVVFNLPARAQVPLIELAAGGGMIDRDFFVRAFPEIKTHYHLIAHLLHLLRTSYPRLAIMKHDALIHYSSDNIVGYIKKIIWRVKNNIFFVETIGASGFSGREVYQSFQFRIKKYFFLPYAFSLVLPFVDAMYLSLTRKDLSYIIHVPLTVITAVFILYFSCLKALGARPMLTSYDLSTEAYEKK